MKERWKWIEFGVERIDGAFNLDRKLSENTGICCLDIIMLGSGMMQ